MTGLELVKWPAFWRENLRHGAHPASAKEIKVEVFSEGGVVHASGRLKVGSDRGFQLIPFITILGEQRRPVLALLDSARRAPQPRLLVRHLQEEEEGQLLHVIAIRQAVIAQDAAVVPELGDEGGGVGHEI